MTGIQLAFPSDEFGGVLVFNGRGGFCNLAKVTTAEVLERFDAFAAWVRAGNGRPDDDVSDAARALVVEACRQGELILRAEAQS